MIHLILSSVTGVHTFHSYTPVASDKLYLTANVKVVVHFRISLSSRRGSVGILRIIHLENMWWRVVSFTSRPLYFVRKRPR